MVRIVADYFNQYLLASLFVVCADGGNSTLQVIGHPCHLPPALMISV
jgi:hypothetical protein